MQQAAHPRHQNALILFLSHSSNMFCLFANINLFAQSDKKTILFNFANSP
jgi:hypothetical protein